MREPKGSGHWGKGMKDSLYQALKAEQSARITFRDGALYINLVALISIVGAYVQQGDLQVLLLIPTSAAVFSMLYGANDFYITRISQFVEHQGTAHGEWEVFHRRGVAYRVQKVIRHILVLASFFVVPVGVMFVVGSKLLLSPCVIGAVMLLLLIEYGILFMQRLPAGMDHATTSSVELAEEDVSEIR